MTTNSLVIIGLLIVTFVSGFMLGSYSNGMTVGTSTLLQNREARPNDSVVTDDGASSSDTTTIPSSSLTEDQKKLIRALGMDPETILITPAMISCAESSLGIARVTEIKNGATPSFAEGVRLAACYR